jgi:putative ATPase
MPSSIGYEAKIRDEVFRKRELQAAIILGEGQDDRPAHGGANPAEGEILSWSPGYSKGREGWFKRLESGRSALLLADRDAILGALPFKRHDRILIPNANDGLLLWESLRRVPEGLCAALVSSESAKEALEGYMALLEESEKPIIGVFPQSGQAQGTLPVSQGAAALPSPAEAEAIFGTPIFDHIALREPWRRSLTSAPSFKTFAKQAAELIKSGGTISLLSSPPLLGERISRILTEQADQIPDNSINTALAAAEEAFFTDTKAPWSWTVELLEAAFTDCGFSVSITVLDKEEERLITEKDMSTWFDQEKSAWGRSMASVLGDQGFAELRKRLLEQLSQGPLIWRWKSLLVKAVK